MIYQFQQMELMLKKALILHLLHLQTHSKYFRRHYLQLAAVPLELSEEILVSY